MSRLGGRLPPSLAGNDGAGDGGDVAPFLDADFRTASLSLLMMRGSDNMHLAFHAREAKVWEWGAGCRFPSYVDSVQTL